MSKKTTQQFFAVGGEFTIPKHMLPAPTGGFISVADYIAKIEPHHGKAIDRAFDAYLRSNGGTL